LQSKRAFGLLPLSLLNQLLCAPRCATHVRAPPDQPARRSI